MTDTIDSTSATATGSEAETPKKRGGLGGMLLADLKAMAAGMGIQGAGSMKKADLIAAIKDAQGSRTPTPAKTAPAAQDNPAAEKSDQEGSGKDGSGRDGSGKDRQAQRSQDDSAQEKGDAEDGQGPRRTRQRGGQGRGNNAAKAGNDQRSDGDGRAARREQGNASGEPKDGRQDNKQGQGDSGNAASGNDDNDGDNEGGSRRNRRRRGRDRDRNRGRGEPDTTILEDDVLVPAAGILDVLDNYAFVRTSGYLPGPDDVYLSLSLVKRLGLRRGDAVVGQVRQPREGERKEKYNPMVRIDSVNGADPETAKHRVEFDKLAPVHPDERLRLETTADGVIGRVIDLVAPIGKGQRGLIAAPSKAGKTTVLRAISDALTANNPECHLMVVLVDERPEEVTDFERSVKGEVIASTFDRQPADHAVVAELAIERAKRLVELGHDVVVLLDGLTRLGRAYNLSAPASGRVLGGGVDAAALYPTKRFFGAARNVEDGGSLTILATAAEETGSKTDEVILEAFKDTANSEVRLSGAYAEDGVFPAIDVQSSATRRDDLLLSGGERDAVRKLRASLASLEGEKAATVLLEKITGTPTNLVLLGEVAKS